MSVHFPAKSNYQAGAYASV